MPKRIHVAFVLRMWREKPTSNWRASLVNVQTAQQQHFSRLRELVAFLESSTGETLEAQNEAEQQCGHSDGIAGTSDPLL